MTKANQSRHDRSDGANTRVLTREQGRQFFDRHAQRELGISGEEFLRRCDAGEYRPIPDTPEGRKVGRLVMLLPFVRRIESSPDRKE